MADHGRKGGPHNERFDFLGFEFYWEPDRKGIPRVKRRRATQKHLAALERIRNWIKEHRHQKLSQTLKTLKAKLQGTWNYYGIIGNFRRMHLLYDEACRALYKSLNRRSQRKSLTWPAVRRLLARYQVPRPRIVEQIGCMPCQLDLSLCQRMGSWLLVRQGPMANARAS